MRKLTVLAMLATVLMAGSAFAVNRNFAIQPNATFAFGAPGVAFGPSSTNNDDTCDIGTAPAATLLLPYFEVDFKSTQNVARTTLFTVTNVSFLPQIAHVVVWTDWSFPVLDFNIFLTGFDVQAINLYDVLARGVIAPPSGTSSNTTVPTNPTAGSQPAANTGNPNINSLAGCTALPGAIPPTLLAAIQSALTTGVFVIGGAGVSSCTSTQIVGGTHANAIGYITIDVNANCNTNLPVTPGGVYFTQNILFDNVLIGDYENVQPNPAVINAAGGANMVSIRAVPEGGLVGSSANLIPPTNLPDTFYDRYFAGTGLDPRTDRRQPLPSTFAARYIQGGTGSFNTNFQIWREGITQGACTGAQAASSNSALSITEIVRFDEHENATTVSPTLVISPQPTVTLASPETSSNPTTSALFPAMPTAAGDIAGWMFLNLHNGGSTNFSRNGVPVAVGNLLRASQNWVTVNLQAESRFSVLFDANWLGNGCSPVAAASTTGANTIGPAGGVLVCPPPLVRTGAAGQCAVSPVGTNATPP